jgi:hypothetical protein
MQKSQKSQKKSQNNFCCKPCDYITSKKFDYDKHCLTHKHNTTVVVFVAQPKSRNFSCPCGKNYNHRASLFNHKKVCKHERDEQVVGEPTIDEPTIDEPTIDELTRSIENISVNNTTDVKLFTAVMMEMLKSNADVHKQMLEICKINSTVHNSINTVNSHNKTFNLMVFLNENCKDAMNMSEFVDSFDLQLSDLESVGELGYVDGITKIFVDKLSSMDVYKRPIHCSDAKREIIYIKDEDRWEKEKPNNPKLRKAIKNVSFKNMKLAALWSDTHPDSKASESRLNDVYIKIVLESTGGKGEIAESQNKIIKRIAKEIVINKNNF